MTEIVERSTITFTAHEILHGAPLNTNRSYLNGTMLIGEAHINRWLISGKSSSHSVA